MGHKVHPMGFRIGVIRDWQAKWYSDKHYAEFLQEERRYLDYENVQVILKKLASDYHVAES